MTMGVRQAMGALRGRGAPNSYRGNRTVSRNTPSSNSGSQMNAVGGGIEIDYDER